MAYKYSTGSLRQGDLYFEDDRTGAPTWIDWGQDTITLRPSGSAILYLESGKVGIGTTSPDNTLHVKSDETTHIKIESEAGYEAALKIKSGGQSSAYIWQPGSTSDLRFYINGADVMHLDNDGNVGIGTTTPDYTLDVAGNVGINEYIYHNGDADTFIRLEPDEINIEVGGENMIFLVEGSGGDQADKVTINNDLADVDFQVKGDNDANLIRTDILYVKTDGKIYWISNELSETDLTAGAGGGEVNTASNLGDSDDGEGLFDSKSSSDLQFKRIKGGVGTALTSETNDVLIDSLTRLKQEGCKFSYTDAETITLSPNGLDSKATVGILSGTTFSAVELSSDLTCDLSTSGAGGLDTGSEANSTGYYVFVIAQAAGASPALLCSTSDTSPTMPTDYVYQSEPIWFISNDSSGDLVDFVDMNGKCFYREPAAVLASGLGYSAWTLINCSVVAPNNSVAFVEAWVRPKSTTAWNSLRFHWSNANAINSTFYTLRFVNVIRNVNGSGGTEHLAGNFPLIDASAGMYYQWGSDPGSGGAYPPSFNVWLRGWTLL